MKKIYSIDDHEIIHKGLENILGETDDLRLAGASLSVADALEKIPAVGDLDLILLDITMPKITGISGLRLLRAKFPDTPVAIFTAQPENLYGANVTKLKAAGFIEKILPVSEVVAKIRRIANGEEERLSKKTDERYAGRPLFKKLSARETEVLKLLTAGKKNKHIAQELGLDEKTVSTYKLRVLKKFNVSSTIELINHAGTLDFFKE